MNLVNAKVVPMPNVAMAAERQRRAERGTLSDAKISNRGADISDRQQEDNENSFILRTATVKGAV